MNVDTQHIVSAFDRELGQLTQHILDMGIRIENLIDIALQSFAAYDDNHTKAAKIHYKKIIALDVAIDKEAIAMLALRQPKAVDLRLIISTIKISALLERMGNLTINIVKRAKLVEANIAASLLNDFDSIAYTEKKRLSDVMTAFKNRDIELTGKIWACDEASSEFNKSLCIKMQDLMIKNSDSIPSYIEMLFVAKKFERLGDYTTRLAGNVHYIISGKRAKKIKKKKAA